MESYVPQTNIKINKLLFQNLIFLKFICTKLTRYLLTNLINIYFTL